MRIAMHRWFSARAVLLHLECFLFVAGCFVVSLEGAEKSSAEGAANAGHDLN